MFGGSTYLTNLAQQQNQPFTGFQGTEQNAIMRSTLDMQYQNLERSLMNQANRGGYTSQFMSASNQLSPNQGYRSQLDPLGVQTAANIRLQPGASNEELHRQITQLRQQLDRQTHSF